MGETAELEQIAKIEESLKQYVQQYLDHRKPESLIGEFLDDEGCQLDQFGLGGVAFFVSLKKRLGYEGKSIIMAEKNLANGLEKEADKRDLTEFKLLKDIEIVSAKSALISICSDKKALINKQLKSILIDNTSNNMVVPIIDATSLKGDAVITCYVLQLLKFSRYVYPKYIEEGIEKILAELKKQLLLGNFGIVQKLYISSTMCMYDFGGNVRTHRRLLSELYKSSEDWQSYLTTTSPFIDTWYGDNKANRNRYLRIPKGYVVLSSIYILFGDKKKYISFKPVRKILSQITLPYFQYVKVDRSRAAVYFIFFLLVALNPEKYIDASSVRFWVRWRNKFDFQFNNLTMAGILVLLATVISIPVAIFYSVSAASKLIAGVDASGALSNFVAWFSLFLTGIMGLMRTRRI